MLIIRPHLIFCIIAALFKQPRIIKAHLMTGHIAVTGKIIHLRRRIYHALSIQPVLIAVKNPFPLLIGDACRLIRKLFPAAQTPSLPLYHIRHSCEYPAIVKMISAV